jgi:hypothetical protein
MILGLDFAWPPRRSALPLGWHLVRPPSVRFNQSINLSDPIFLIGLCLIHTKLSPKPTFVAPTRHLFNVVALERWAP